MRSFILGFIAGFVAGVAYKALRKRKLQVKDDKMNQEVLKEYENLNRRHKNIDKWEKELS